MLLIAIMGTVNATLADDITVGDVSNSDCPHTTRTEGVVGHTILKLTRSEVGLVGELRNFYVNCGYGDVNVFCEEDGNNLTIVVDDDSYENMTDCFCPINIYFTLFNAMQEEFQLKVRGISERNVGAISLKGHTMVEIDLTTLVILYDEGFEWHLGVQNFTASNITNYGTPQDMSQKLIIRHESETVFSCVYEKYVLPLDYSYLDVKATLDDDSTLVINVLTDGIPDKNGKWTGCLYFDIVNTFKDAYHLRVNHTILLGSENEQTTCLYEGDITVPLYEKATIPLEPTSKCLYVEPLWYYVDFFTKTATVHYSDTYKSLSNIDILPSVELWGFDCPVDKIGDHAFSYLTDLESITIPESVKEIGQEAFYGCTGLTSITLPESVREIGQEAFYGCTGLTSINIPKDVREIGQEAFYGCTGLTSINIPEDVREIGQAAFYGCTSLASITIPEGVIEIRNQTFQRCTGLTSVSFPSSLVSIGDDSFGDCFGLTSVTLPHGLTSIGWRAFMRCRNLKEVDIPASVTSIDDDAFAYCEQLEDVYCRAATPPYTNNSRNFRKSNPEATLHVPAASLQVYKETAPWNKFKYIVPIETDLTYHPMIEDDKVWKAWGANSGNPAQIVYYYYFDGDTIIDGKTCKQMMCQQYVSPDYPYYDFYAQPNYLSKVGAWYEEDKQVYLYDTTNEQFKLMYDFSLADNGTFQVGGQTYVVGPKQTGGLEGFKGVYRDVMTDESLRCTTWLEGVGGINGPFANAFDPTLTDLGQFLMSCTVGDEVIYLNDEYEDGATPEDAGARNRFDFTHTIKNQPHSPMRGEAEPSIYGEYNGLQLSIHLDPLDDAYLVRITNESGKAVYEKNINAGNIVGLNIDISGYAKGRYTVTVENSHESFTGVFEAQMTGIGLTPTLSKGEGAIYNLQGQRIRSLQKGLNIVNGRKVYVK